MPKTVADIINLADVAQNPLRPTYLREDVTNAVGSLVLLQIYARQAAQQGTIDPGVVGDDGDKDLLPALCQHQVTAKRTAAHLNQSVAPAVVGTLTDILAFSSTMDAFIDAIMPLLPQVSDCEYARSQVLALIGQLELEADKRGNAARSVATELSVALAKAQADAKNFDADVAEVKRVILSDKGELAQVQKDIADTQRRIGGAIAGIVVSSLVLVGGVVIIGVGALATLPAGVAASSVILAGVGVTVTGATGLTAAAVALGTDNARLSALYEQSARLNVTVTLVGAIADQVTSLADVSSGLSEATGTLATEWATVRAGIATLRQDVTRASDASDLAHIITALRLAQQDWQAITEQSQALMSRLVDLTPREVESVLTTSAAA